MLFIVVIVSFSGALSLHTADRHRLNELEDLVVRDLYGDSVENVWIDLSVRGEVSSLQLIVFAA